MLRLQQAIQAGRVKPSVTARVELLREDGSVHPHPGRLIFSDLAVDPNTGSVQLRAEFPNPKRELLPGTFVRIRIYRAEMENAFTVPQRAVQMTPQGQFVTVVDGEGKATQIPVKTGAMSGTDWIIAEGLKGGEQVVVNGLQKVRPGVPVKPVPWSPPNVATTAPATPAPAGSTTK
jgi:membrane fusion protein (multidrug efflux system)